MEKPFEFYKILNCVHKPNRVNHAVCDKIEGAWIDEQWHIAIPADAGTVLKYAAADLQEYFRVSMGVKLEICTGEACEKAIAYMIDPTLGERTFRIQSGNYIVLTGCDERYAAQAGYALEDTLNLNEGPVIAADDRTMKVRFSPRIIHTGMASGLYTDEHLRMLAHYGYNCIPMGTSAELLENPAKRAKVRDVMLRAKKYGIDVYTSAPFHNERHPDDPDAYEYYDARYGKLVELLPELKMLLIVGECCEFPSHDERTTGKTWRESLNDEKSSPGWFPCRDYPQFVALLNRVIHAHNPNCELVFWTYNWGYEKQELREALMRAVPEDVTMMATFEMFEEFDIKPQVREICTDYTLWSIGPGKYFSTESAVARERNIRMYSMTNTGGNTWDIGDVPYLPAPQRWIERWNAVANAQDNLRLDGIMESHTYGFWPSILPEIAKYAYMIPQPDLSDLLRRLVIRDFGAENADTVLRAYELFSEGMAHCVSTNEDQYGPARVGPSYPLIFEKRLSIPAGPLSKASPDREANPIYRYNLDLEEKLLYEADEYAEMARLFDAGVMMLDSVKDCAHEAAFDELTAVSKFIGCTAHTIENVKRWHHLKGQLGIYLDTNPIWVGGRKHMPDAVSAKKPLVPAADPKPILLKMLDIARAELANAASVLPIVENHSRIGYTQELDYCASPEQVKWKIAELEKVINDEILPKL